MYIFSKNYIYFIKNNNHIIYLSNLNTIIKSDTLGEKPGEEDSLENLVPPTIVIQPVQTVNQETET